MWDKRRLWQPKTEQDFYDWMYLEVAYSHLLGALWVICASAGITSLMLDLALPANMHPRWTTLWLGLGLLFYLLRLWRCARNARILEALKAEGRLKVIKDWPDDQ